MSELIPTLEAKPDTRKHIDVIINEQQQDYVFTLLCPEGCSIGDLGTAVQKLEEFLTATWNERVFSR